MLHNSLSSADFVKKNQKKSKKSFKNATGMSNSLDPDQARHFIGPDLGPNCLHRLSARLGIMGNEFYIIINSLIHL